MPFLDRNATEALYYTHGENPHDNLIQTTNNEQKKNFEIKGDTLTQHRCTKVVQRFKG